MKKLKVTKRYFNYLVFSDEKQQTVIQKRTAKGIWHNLYEFPVIETENPETDETILTLITNHKQVINTICEIVAFNSEPILHKLSHQHLHIKFWKIKVIGILANGIDCVKAKTFPFPIVVYNFIEKDWD